jgi:hypothetical protein
MGVGHLRDGERLFGEQFQAELLVLVRGLLVPESLHQDDELAWQQSLAIDLKQHLVVAGH